VPSKKAMQPGNSGAADMATDPKNSDVPAHEVPEFKPSDEEDESAAGEEDPGAAIEEMHDPHPDAKPPGMSRGK
jgi:hypothetical protein